MAQFLAILTLINQLFPLVIQTVRTVEAAFPQSGAGPVKLEMVRGMLEHAYSQTQSAETTFDQLWPMLSVMIAGIVKTSNVVNSNKLSGG